MTHLRIELNNGLIEEVSGDVISKLYDIVHSGNLDNTSNLIGRLHTSATYQNYIDYLEDTFKIGDVKLLIIDATKKYLRFADPEIRRVFANTYGDNVGVTKSDLSGVTKIPNRMFEGNTAITSFDELGDLTNITELDYYCFNEATNLHSIDLSNIEIVRQGALCSVPLEVINLPKATSIEDVFGSSVLREVNIGSEVPDNLKITSIPNAFLRDRTSVTTVTGLKMVTEIGNFGFGNTRLSEVDTTSNLTTIGTAAFWLTKIKCIDLSGVTTLSGDSLFSSCSELIDLSTSDQTLINTGAATYTFNWSTIPNNLFKSCKLTNKSFSFPNATSIGESAFRSTGIVGIISPNATSIGGNVFQQCSSLTLIDLSNVISIDNSAFEDCSSLISVDLPNCTSIGNYTFKGCSALTSVDLSDVISISSSAFENCSALTNIDLSSCTSLGSSAFKGCSSLSNIDLPNVITIGDEAFRNCIALTNVRNLSNVTSIDTYAFYGCSLLTSIDLSNVTTIGDSAFNGCTNLVNIGTLNSSLTTIPLGCFRNCSSLTNLDLSHITSLGSDAFNNCTSLGVNQTLELNLSNLTFYPQNALYGTKYTRLILHSPQLLGTYDSRYPLYEQMNLLLYLDLSDWRPAKNVFNNADYGDGSFYNNASLVTYIAPITVNNIGTIIQSLGNYSNFRYFILLPTTPPILNTTDSNNPPSRWFNRKSGNVHIYVPDSAKAAYLADADWATIGGYDGSDTIADRLHGLSELPAGVWTTGLASLYLTPAQLATS